MRNSVRRSLELRSRRGADPAGDRWSIWRTLAAPTGVAATGLLVGALVVGCGSDSDDPFDLPKPSGPATVPTELPTDLDLPTGLPSGIPTEIPTEIPTDLPSGIPTDFELPTGVPTGLLESSGIDAG